MLTAVTFLTALSQIAEGNQNACVPGSSFSTNNRFCVCDDSGAWSEPHCYTNNETCKQGELVQRGCSICTCDNGQLSCNDAGCNETRITQREYNVITPGCLPYMSYFVDCRICTCPASGDTIHAICFSDPSCNRRTSSSPEFILSRNMCIPGVMYLFPCLSCLCSENGKFSAPNCYDTCTIKQAQCHPKTFYRNDCNVCYCPANGIKDNKICSTADCTELTKTSSLRQHMQKQATCFPHSFTKPKCLYCDCSSIGQVNDNTCLELECIDVDGLEYNVDRVSCQPGAMVLVCSECLCLESGTTHNAYCSKTCTYESKLEVINKILKDSIENENLLNQNNLRKASGTSCRPETVYLHEDKYCLCPNDGTVNRSLCSSINVEQRSMLNKIQNYKEKPKQMKIEFGVPCKIGTFVQFDCNSCFCSDGSIDANWCTYDDCAARTQPKPKKHQFLNSGILAPSMPAPATEPVEYCNAGSITKTKCNFCICPDSGLWSERVCTRNDCTTTHQPIQQDFSCQPMHYYEVDCNVCLCPEDGQKNVDKCTKNVCQKSFLRTNTDTRSCTPGQLFSYECNVCVCPSNGKQEDKACTDHICPDSDANLMIFKRSPDQSALEERKLDFCFTGEQFIEDCKFCVCPDTGLKAHSTCNSMLCDDEQRRLKHKGLGSQNHQRPYLGRTFLDRPSDQCETFFEDQVIDRQDCKPGLIYTSGCKQCICPSDNEERFCRTIPSVYCASPQASTDPHTHEDYPCSTPGKLADPCFICDCEDQDPRRVVVREHCFKSESAACKGATPTFLNITLLL